MKSVLFVILIIFFAGCEEDMADRKKLISDNHTPSTGRFDLEKVQTFEDRDAYSGNRSIYILTDSETGKEYVGISGVGISELGSHSQPSGKTVMTVSDER